MMSRIRAFIMVCVLAVVAAACQTGATPRTTAASPNTPGVPSPIASIVPLTCGFTGPPPRGGRHIEFAVNDTTALIHSCEVFDAGSDVMPIDAFVVGVTNAEGDLRALQLRWVGGVCADRGSITLDSADGHFRLVISTESKVSETECPAIGVPYGARLALSGPIRASSVDGVYEPGP